MSLSWYYTWDIAISLRSSRFELIYWSCIVLHLWFSEGSSPPPSDHHQSGHHSYHAPQHHHFQLQPLSYGWRLWVWLLLPVGWLVFPGLLNVRLQGRRGGYSVGLPLPCDGLGRCSLPYGLVGFQSISGIQASRCLSRFQNQLRLLSSLASVVPDLAPVLGRVWFHARCEGGSPRAPWCHGLPPNHHHLHGDYP